MNPIESDSMTSQSSNRIIKGPNLMMGQIIEKNHLSKPISVSISGSVCILCVVNFGHNIHLMSDNYDLTLIFT